MTRRRRQQYLYVWFSFTFPEFPPPAAHIGDSEVVSRCFSHNEQNHIFLSDSSAAWENMAAKSFALHYIIIILIFCCVQRFSAMIFHKEIFNWRDGRPEAHYRTGRIDE